MPWLIALVVPTLLSFGRSLFANTAGTAMASAAGGYFFGQATAPKEASIWPSVTQLLGVMGVLLGAVLLFKQVKGLLR